MESLLYGTPHSVIASIIVALVVVIASTRTVVISILSIITIAGVITTSVAVLVLMEWYMNIVESTIIILVIGLSFDFTLLYAVAYKLAPQQEDVNTRVHLAFQFISIPVRLRFNRISFIQLDPFQSVKSHCDVMTCRCSCRR